MDSRLEVIINKYKYDKSRKKYSEKHFKKWEIDGYFSKIKSKEDILKVEEILVNEINYYNNNDKRYIMQESIDNLEKDLGKYEISISKILQCYKYKEFNFDYSAEELEKLIKKISIYENKIKELNLIMMCSS